MNLNNTKLWSWHCLNSCYFAAPLPGSLNYRTCNFVPHFLSHPITLPIPRGHLCSPEKRSSPAFPTKQLFSFLFLWLQLKYLTFLSPSHLFINTFSQVCEYIFYSKVYSNFIVLVQARNSHKVCWPDGFQSCSNSSYNTVLLSISHFLTSIFDCFRLARGDLKAIIKPTLLRQSSSKKRNSGHPAARQQFRFSFFLSMRN